MDKKRNTIFFFKSITVKKTPLLNRVNMNYFSFSAEKYFPLGISRNLSGEGGVKQSY